MAGKLRRGGKAGEIPPEPSEGADPREQQRYWRAMIRANEPSWLYEGERTLIEEGWVFLLPSNDDVAAIAGKGTIGYLAESLALPMTARDSRGKKYIVVCTDDDRGKVAGRAAAEAATKAKAAEVKLWRLPRFGTEHATLRAWCEHHNWDTMLEAYKPWRPGLGVHTYSVAGKVVEDQDAGELNGNGNGASSKLPRELIESHAATIQRLATKARFFRTAAGDPYVTIPVNSHFEHHPAGGEKVRQWLLYEFWKDKQAPPTADAVKVVQDTLVARASFEATETAETCLRVAQDVRHGPDQDDIFLDLGTRGLAVSITGVGGWKLIDNPPVRFRRPGGLAPLPEPVGGGSLDELWDLTNVESPQARTLLLAALTYWLNPRGPYPVLVLTGEQGSAKSTTTRLLKHAIDPCRPVLGTQPESLRDLMVIAAGTWVLTFDNISKLPPWFSDSLARLATGAGFQVRKHYSDDESQVFEASRPMILNGIEEFATRADLLSRALLISCPPIPDERRKEERAIWRAFERAHPRILGAILDATAGALAQLPLVELSARIRLADFERWGEAVCRHLGEPAGTFSEVVRLNRDQATAAVLEEAPVAVALQSLRVPGDTWEGTCLELLEKLADNTSAATRDGAGWPRSPRGLSGQLRRLAPALRSVGIAIEFPQERQYRDAGGGSQTERVFTITWDRGRSEAFGTY